MVAGSARLGPLSDYTANCKPVLSSVRAPHSKLFGLLLQPQMIDNDECRVDGGATISRGNRSNDKKPALMSVLYRKSHIA
jgi:hypothetical protein